MSEPFWATKFKGKPVRLSLGDLSVQRLRQMKAWFGEAYGIPTEFIALLLRGDMDAMACAVWIGQQKGRGEVTDPREMDFSLEDFEALEDETPPAEKRSRGKKADPTQSTPTPDSQSGASTSSTTDTSSTSPTSAD